MIRDFVFAACIAGYSTSSLDGSIPAPILGALVDVGKPVIPQGIAESDFGILRAAHASGDCLAEALFHEGLGVLPTLLLHPDEALRLPIVLFPESSGVLPRILCSQAASDGYYPVTTFTGRHVS
jgi:hypothetical protein